MKNKTIIYYTSNTEKPEFEKKITDNILKVSSGLPIISVSQKPMDFGTNICVGDVGRSYLNAFRQLEIGCKYATTPYVIMAESDTLYPPDYFEFKPKSLKTIYNYDNIWILKIYKDHFLKKECTHASLIYGRKFLLKILEEAIGDKPYWSKEKIGFEFYKPEYKWEYFHGDNPIINIKTNEAIYRNTSTDQNVEPVERFDYWGSAKDLKKEYDLRLINTYTSKK